MDMAKPGPGDEFSPHGLTRISMEALLARRFVHLASGVDPSMQVHIPSCGTPTTISGYTEWVSPGQPGASLGWDWVMHVVAANVCWIRASEPRSNILLVDGEGHDYAWPRNLEVLGTLVDALPWKEVLPEAVALRYA